MFRFQTSASARAHFGAFSLLSAIALAAPVVAHADQIDFSEGFASAELLAINQSAVPGLSWNAIDKKRLFLTTNQYGPGGVAPFEREAAFYKGRVNVSKFETSFDFQIVGNQDWMADGITFCIQNQGLNALGSSGGGLGYGPDPVVKTGDHIAQSVAIKFDVYQNTLDPSVSSTGIFADGVAPIGGYDLSKNKINLRSGNVFRVEMHYEEGELLVLLTDTKTHAKSERKYQVDIPHIVGDKSAYVGFTGATGGAMSEASILNWKYESPNLHARASSIKIDVKSICGGLATQGEVTIEEGEEDEEAVVVALSSSNPLVIVPEKITIPAGKKSAVFPIKTRVTQKSASVSVTATLASQAVKTSLMVCPIGVDFATVSQNYVAAGQPSIGVVTLQLAATPGALTVQLSSDNPAVASVPATATVAAGAISVSFPITTGAVSINTPVLITAKLNGSRRTTTLTVRPLRVESVTTAISKAAGGETFKATVSIEAPATSGGVAVKLSSNSQCLQTPDAVLIPAGAKSVSFIVTTSAVKSSVNAIITASSPVNNVYAKVTVAP